MKHLHMLMAALTVVLFLYQSYLVLSADRRAPRVVKIATHIIYALLILSGAMMLMQLMGANAPVQCLPKSFYLSLLLAQVSKRLRLMRHLCKEKQVSLLLPLPISGSSYLPLPNQQTYFNKRFSVLISNRFRKLSIC